MQYKKLVRVIAGTAKGRKLHVLPGTTTRPTPARVREALFSIVAAHVPGAQVLDLFAGSGALGIEALSRGAASATFVDSDHRVAALLHRNLQGMAQAHVRVGSAHHAIAAFAASHVRFDLVFVDPPYRLNLIGPMLQLLVRHAILSTDALVICAHHGKAETVVAPAPLRLHLRRGFGDVALSLYGAP